MKKLISCLLTVALVFSLMGVSVFAGRIVGYEDQDPAINNGVDNFDEKSDSQVDINVNFNINDNNGNGGAAGTTTLIHKYAIDITYAELIIDLTQTKTTITIADDEKDVYQVWDVSDHEYVDCIKDGDKYVPVSEAIADAQTNSPQTTTDTETTAGPLTINNAFQVTNHSDLAVDYKAVLTNNKTDSILFSFNLDATIANDQSTVTTLDTTNRDEFITLAAVVSRGQAVEGAAYNIIANPKTTWNDTINNLQPSAGTGTFVVGNIVITVKPA